ncbi:hypothetical protein JL108_00655 [Aeromicrobium sp. YIM 150415]|uniref:DUF6752 domain-containing protein n=1 Tax=Aeromicrobium sp. YIM 150415 TaxID=2803912 RepID=UPI0019668F45|nr:DUF6752 domain-containing protein [Aeromicrobium sp. YIM 150415]MBM9461935.1 hypothetical protein [Aeromicrobium sp. YIM 150415]
MKRKILSALRAISPRLAERVARLGRRVSSAAPSADSGDRTTQLEAAVERLTTEVRELREEIDESRRDALRIAELTDIVERRLAKDGE